MGLRVLNLSISMPLTRPRLTIRKDGVGGEVSEQFAVPDVKDWLWRICRGSRAAESAGDLSMVAIRTMGGLIMLTITVKRFPLHVAYLRRSAAPGAVEYYFALSPS